MGVQFPGKKHYVTLNGPLREAVLYVSRAFLLSTRRYMMKSREFNYELHKNTELLQNKDNWQDLLDYRVELERASKSFQRSHNATS